MSPGGNKGQRRSKKEMEEEAREQPGRKAARGEANKKMQK